MTIPGSANPLLLASAAEAGAYAIERSVRFNSADSAYLSRTPASAGNRKTWTWAGWVKKTALNGSYPIFSAGVTATSYLLCRFRSGDTFGFDQYGTATNFFVQTTAVFRDASAWYHVVFAFDTTQSTQSNRIKLYINGVQQTLTAGTNWPTQNADLLINNNIAHSVGSDISNLGGGYLNGYLADVHFIDGQALDPTSFGEFDTNGIWQPIAYSGSYGTNGFHLPFSNNSTAAALGTDTSGNGNTWTVNNISITNSFPYSRSSTLNSATTIFTAGNTSYVTAAFNSGGFQTITAEPVVISSSLTYTTNNAGNNGTRSLRLTRASDNAVTTVTTTTSGGWSSEIPSGFKGVTLSKLEWERTFGSYENISQIAIDGVQMVDRVETTDSLVDVPTNGSETDTGVGAEVRGNYCTLNPLNLKLVTLSNGNLEVNATGSTTYQNGAAGTIAVSSGKWYWEVTAGSNQDMFGVYDAAYSVRGFPGEYTGEVGYYASAGTIYPAGSAYGNSYTSGDIIGVALDLDNGKIWFAKNGTWQNSGSPTGGTNAAATGLTGLYAPGVRSNNTAASTTAIANFGQRPFAYTAPSGFKALCTANLDAPTIEDGSTVMDVALYTGNGSTQTISGLDFSPDLVWIKNRAAADSHKLTDTIRGATEELESDTTAAEATNADGLTQFNSDGFDLGADAEYNTNTETYVAWCWDAGSSTVTNTDGSISSQVRANASAGFSIVTWTGNGSASQTVGHGLNAAPELLIQKRRDSSENWLVYHSALGNAAYLKLNGTDAAVTGSSVWESTDPTSSVFTISNSTWHNASGGTYVSYCFAPVDGYTVASSYTGNGNADGPFVFTNMRPRWILIKRTDTTSNWTIIDTAREGYNVDNDPLFPNLSNAEGTTDLADILSNGFKLRTTDASVNANTGTYIYFAIAEAAFNYSRAR